MGQAKRRGTFEQRRAKALARRAGIVIDESGNQIASVVPVRSYRKPSPIIPLMLAMAATAWPTKRSLFRNP